MNENKRGGRMIVISLIGIRKKIRSFFHLFAILIILILSIALVLKFTSGEINRNTVQQPANSGTLIQINYLHHPTSALRG